MSEFTLPVSPEQTSATASSSIQNTTQTAAPEPQDRCGLQRDALRGILSEMKAQIKILQERQDALHRCMTGRSLTDTLQWGGGSSVAVNLIGDLAMMAMCIDRIAFTAGVTLDGP